MKLRIAASALVAVSLAGCAPGSPPSPKALITVNQALAFGCPIVGAVQGAGLKLNKYQTGALDTLALACPPNPPPTSEAVALADVLSAISILQPLLVKH
jgi:hypothetical protein